jgi:dolichyl-phosphate beta-glucosyltransferase
LQSLSLIIPAYNEEKRLPGTLDKVFAYLAASSWASPEVIVVDDGSRDGTAALVEKASAKWPSLRLVRNPGNRGKGYAVRHGMQQARNEWLLVTDADLSSPIEELDKLWAAAERSNSAGAIGSRALDRTLVGVHQSTLREFAGRTFNFVMRVVTGLPFRDTQCGFKLFRREVAACVAARQVSDGFGFDVEILYIARKHGFSIVEVPVRWDNAEGTKVSIWNGLAAFADPLGVRWNDLKGLYK